MKSCKRILVADDNSLIREMLCALLKDHESMEICDEAVDGQDAVKKDRLHKPDIIILDLSIPRMDGLQPRKQSANFYLRFRSFFLRCTPT